jgi:hypothetical protein
MWDRVVWQSTAQVAHKERVCGCGWVLSRHTLTSQTSTTPVTSPLMTKLPHDAMARICPLWPCICFTWLDVSWCAVSLALSHARCSSSCCCWSWSAYDVKLWESPDADLRILSPGPHSIWTHCNDAIGATCRLAQVDPPRSVFHDSELLRREWRLGRLRWLRRRQGSM